MRAEIKRALITQPMQQKFLICVINEVQEDTEIIWRHCIMQFPSLT